MKVSEFVTVAAITGSLSVGGMLAAYQPEPPPPPKCDINEKALSAITEQNQALLQSNQDLRLAIANMPDNEKQFIEDHEKAKVNQRLLEDKIWQADEAKAHFEQLEKSLKCPPTKAAAPGKTSGLTTGDILLGAVKPGDVQKKSADGRIGRLTGTVLSPAISRTAIRPSGFIRKASTGLSGNRS